MPFLKLSPILLVRLLDYTDSHPLHDIILDLLTPKDYPDQVELGTMGPLSTSI